MTDLHNATPEELQSELARRQRPRIPAPEQLSQPDFRPLADLVQHHVDEAVERGFIDKGFDDDVVESVISCLYGTGRRNKFWEWHRQLEANS